MIAKQLKIVKDGLQEGVRLVAVSKYHPVEALQEAYAAGQRVFGESHVQELCAKKEIMPEDTEWHFIGHLQTNKVKYIAPFVSLIHSVDSARLLAEINKQALRAGRRIDVLLQLHMAQEETKFGFAPDELKAFLAEGEWQAMDGIRIRGLMTMATNTDDMAQVESEFERTNELFSSVRQQFFTADDAWFDELSMGMSGDYLIAQRHGATLVRVGSMIFGERNYT